MGSGLRVPKRSGIWCGHARAAKQDQLRARHRLSKFLLRTGQRPAQGMKAWTQAYMVWVQQIRYAQMAQETTKLDYLHEVEHMGERVVRLEQAIAEAIQVGFARRYRKWSRTYRHCAASPRSLR